jgi:predicted HAD superfamily Cof-like phosphohydrolase
MKEENDEYLEACYSKSLIEISDALGDQLYILCGTILKHGMQHIIEDVFAEIQASNMSKLGDDGKPVLRADGKILKGPGYFRPDLSKFIKVDTDASNNIQESND